MLRLPEPGFERLIRTARVPIAQMYRLSRLPATEPYWAKQGGGRFDDPLPEPAHRFGVLYAAQDLSTAFCETFIHEAGLFRAGAYEVAAHELTVRQLITFRHPKVDALELADFTGFGLKRLGLNNDFCAGDDYAFCQTWARAIYEALPGLQGVRYVSRQHNTSHCFAIFERSGLVVRDAQRLPLRDIQMLCEHFNVRPVRTVRLEDGEA